MLNQAHEPLIKEFHPGRLILAGQDIVRADVDGGDPLLRENLHSELELDVCDAEQAGRTDIYADAVRNLERLARVGHPICSGIRSVLRKGREWKTYIFVQTLPRST